MTTDKELVERLESHMGQQDVPVLIHDCREAAARIRELEAERDEATLYAERLARSLAEKHYPQVPRFTPLSGDLIGLLTQIDNMTAVLVHPNAAEARCRKLEEALTRVRDLPAEAEQGVNGAPGSYGVGYAFEWAKNIARRALLDQADGEEGNG